MPEPDSVPAIRPVRIDGSSKPQVGMSSAALATPRNAATREHAHDELQIAVPIAAAKLHASWHDELGRSTSRAAAARSIWVIPPGMPHRATWEGLGDVLWIYIRRELMNEFAGGAPRLSPYLGPGNETALSLIRRLHMDLVAPTAIGPLYREGLAIALAGSLAVRCPARPGPVRARGGLPPARLRAVIDHIEARLGEPIGAVELAALAGLGTSYFLRAFRASTGATSAAFVLERRLAKARRLLLDSRTPLAEVAQQCGFFDQAHLTRRFRIATGTTPGHFRRLGAATRRDAD